MKRIMQQWSEKTGGFRQGCFESVRWNIFKTTSSNLKKNNSFVTGFIEKCIDDDILVKTIRIYHNQKPWINRGIHSLLREYPRPLGRMTLYCTR